MEPIRLETVLGEYARLAEETRKLRFSPPTAYVYHPLDYAWEAHRIYIKRYLSQEPTVVFMGMNPGPFGMAQTGVPFGQIHAVRDWLGIHDGVSLPGDQHPKKPVLGFDCPRSEVSGQRLWGLFRDRYVNPEAFFADHFVINYCPLLFLGETGANLTPVQLLAADQKAVQTVCDASLVRLAAILRPRYLVGIGVFAAERARLALSGTDIQVSSILHPSPASPQANRDWAGQVTARLTGLGIW
jgi:single-strand selective monofunctional uracil DNA glycosylase